MQDGWSVLLPTAAERAQTLTALLPSEPGQACSAGHRFMTDLLVSSLMTEGGLETALQHAIQLESSSSTTDCPDGGHLPLLQLITRLLGNNATLTQSRLAMALMSKHQEDEELRHHHPAAISPSLCLLHRFQRLLLAHIHQAASEEDTTGAEALLSQYLHSLIPACVGSLQQAHDLALQCREPNDSAAAAAAAAAAAGGCGVGGGAGSSGASLAAAIAAHPLGAALNRVLQTDISDALLHELLVGLVLLKRDRPQCLASLRWARLCLPLLRVLDRLNRALGEGELRDGDDMGWPGIICRGGPKGTAPPASTADPETHYVRRADLDNLLLDGGRCIILVGYVCDLSGYK